MNRARDTMPTGVPPLIRALLDPQRYAGDVGAVELLETHISWVLLAGGFAYKIKKPLKLPFLDFSTLERRHYCCLEELRLNRRFSPDIYLGVVGIFHTPEDPRWEGAAPPIEYAVQMQRFDGANRLDRVCARGQLQAAHLTELAHALCAFQAQAAIAEASSHFGVVGDYLALVRDNFHDLRLALPQREDQLRLQALQAWSETQFTALSPLLVARRESGHVREGHGDLHLANLVLINQHVRMFDCIEFNAQLRWLDVADEMAFTYMDLVAHQQPGLANGFIDDMLGCTGDYEAARVLRFFAVYRALVRAKVAAIRMQEGQEDATAARAVIALAERLAAPAPKRLIITHGLSGCGKTHATTQLLQADPLAATVRIRSDVERKRLFGLAAAAHRETSAQAGIYAPRVNTLTYARLLRLGDMLLQAGGTVIVDATFLRHADRQAFRALANQAGARFEILAPVATPAQLTERIEARRAAGHDASDATLDVLAHQLQTLEPLTPDERRLQVP